MKNIIIATTACNRPDLHNESIKDWLKWIYQLDKCEYSIKWFINIDINKQLPDTYEETETNFKNIIEEVSNNIQNEKTNKIDATFLHAEDYKGNFLKWQELWKLGILNFTRK